MGKVETWVKSWWKTNEKDVKRDGGRIVTSVFQGGDQLAVGAGGVCVAMATYWIKQNASGGGAESLFMVMKQGVVKASRYFALRQGIIAIRQEKIAKKVEKDLTQIKSQLANLEKYYVSKKKEEHDAADQALDILLEVLNKIKDDAFKEFLGPLAGGDLKIKQLATGKALGELSGTMDTFDEKKGGRYLMILRSAGGKDLGGAHAIAFQIGDGQWNFMDPNSCELEFVKAASMKKFVNDFFAAFYTKDYKTFDLYEYVR